MEPQQHVVVLVGLPGSGKTTVSERLQALGFVWINQDTMKKRAKCEMAAQRALLNGHSVVIDRCNFNREQRSHWIKMAYDMCGEGVQVVALQLYVAPKECIRRVKARRGHPTLQGDKAPMAINSILGQWEDPSQQEGFHRVVVARSNDDIDRFLAAAATLPLTPAAPPATPASGPPAPFHAPGGQTTLLQSWNRAHPRPSVPAPGPPPPGPPPQHPGLPSAEARFGSAGPPAHHQPGNPHGQWHSHPPPWQHRQQDPYERHAPAPHPPGHGHCGPNVDPQPLPPFPHHYAPRDPHNYHPPQFPVYQPLSDSTYRLPPSPAYLPPTDRSYQPPPSPQYQPLQDTSWLPPPAVYKPPHARSDHPLFLGHPAAVSHAASPTPEPAFAPTHGRTPLDVSGSAPANARPILLFDLNGTLTSHTSKRRSAGRNRLRPGTRELVRLLGSFRLGIYTSATHRTVAVVRQMLEEAAGQPLFEPGLILHRNHTQPAPKVASDGMQGSRGSTWDDTTATQPAAPTSQPAMPTSHCCHCFATGCTWQPAARHGWC